MNTRPIPRPANALPVIGCGTYIGFDQAPATRRSTRSARRRRARSSTPAARCSTARRCTAAPRPTTGELLAAHRPRAASLPRHQGLDPRQDRRRSRQMEASMRLLRTRPHRPDADPQPASTGAPTWRPCALEGRGPDPLPRHHPLHAVGVRRGRVGAARRARSTSSRSTMRSTTARPSGACCRSPPSAASRSSSTCRSAAADCCAVARPAAAGLGRRDRLRELGAAAAEVRPRPSGRDLRDPGTGAASTWRTTSAPASAACRRRLLARQAGVLSGQAACAARGRRTMNSLPRSFAALLAATVRRAP